MTALANEKTLKKRRKILKKTGGVCYICGVSLTPEECTIDHYIPKAKGGSGKLKNLFPSCALCNYLKADTLPEKEKILHLSDKCKDTMRKLLGL